MIFLGKENVIGLVSDVHTMDEAQFVGELPSHSNIGVDPIGDYLDGVTSKKKSKKILENTSDEFDDEIRSIDPSLKEYIQTMENMDAVVYPTNFGSFNIVTGRNVRTETDELLYRVRGIREACVMLIAGNQSVGKSTFYIMLRLLLSIMLIHVLRLLVYLIELKYMPIHQRWVWK